MYANKDILENVYKSDVYKKYCVSMKFGSIYIEESSVAFAHKGYFLPADLTEKQIIEAMEKSVKEDHDFLLDLIANPDNKIVNDSN